MCTLVCRWQPADPVPVQALALRDELASRPFDEPDRWWPDQPGVVGGRDRQAGGSWCVSDVAAGVSAVVLNRPERRVAEPGAPSRGVLPLMAVGHGPDWVEHLDPTGMASFNLVLAGPDGLRWWRFDGQRLDVRVLDPGVHMFTPAGRLETELDQRWTTGVAHDPDAGPTRVVWGDWLAVLDERRPSEDVGGLIVSRPIGTDRYETVFGQFLAARPGRLRLDYLARPVDGLDREWTTRSISG